MKPIITGNFPISYSSENLGNSFDEVYQFVFDGLAARMLLDLLIDTQLAESSIYSYSFNNTGARLIQVDQANFAFQFRNPFSGTYTNDFTYVTDVGTVRVFIQVLVKPAIWAALSECNIVQDVFNNEKYIVKIYESKFNLTDLLFIDKLIGEFETLPSDLGSEASIGRQFQIKLRVDEIISTIERTPFNLWYEFQSVEKALMIIPAVWKYTVSNADESEFYTSGLMYSVNSINENTWYQNLINPSSTYPNQEGWNGNLIKGAYLFTNMGNQYEKLFKDNISTTFVFENGPEENLTFEIVDQSENSLAVINFNYTLFNTFESELRKLPFFFMYLQQNIAESGLPFNEILGKKYRVFVRDGEGAVLPYSDVFLCRKFNGNSYSFNNETFDGFIYEDSLGGFSEFPIELKFNGSFEFETNTAILEKPQTVGGGLQQRIFPIVNNFNFSQDFEASTGYFNSIQLPFYRKILTSKLILFRSRRIFITSASFINVDEPNGLMSIKFTFKFGDNNPYYDRNYPTA